MSAPRASAAEAAAITDGLDAAARALEAGQAQEAARALERVLAAAETITKEGSLLPAVAREEAGRLFQRCAAAAGRAEAEVKGALGEVATSRRAARHYGAG